MDDQNVPDFSELQNNQDEYMKPFVDVHKSYEPNLPTETDLGSEKQDTISITKSLDINSYRAIMQKSKANEAQGFNFNDMQGISYSSNPSKYRPANTR